MRYQKVDKVDDLVGNRYEAVIIAAKRARQINAERLAKLELTPVEENVDIDLDPRKVTTRALEELLAGKLKFER